MEDSVALRPSRENAVEPLLMCICDSCWKRLKGDRAPYRVPHPEQTSCGECGARTRSGIYIALRPDIDAAE